MSKLTVHTDALLETYEITRDAIDELIRARALYPDWPGDIVHASAVMLEEAGEVLKIANEVRWNQKDGTLADVRKETIQTIAMCYRLLLDTPALVEESAS